MSLVQVLRAFSLAAVFALSSPLSAQELALAPSVTVVSPKPHAFERVLRVQGQVVAREEILISPQLSGLPISAILVREGEVVAQDAILAELSREDFTIRSQELSARKLANAAALAQAEASLIEARSTAQEAGRVAERSTALAAQGNLAEANAESARSAFDAANARLRAAEQGIASAEAQGASLEAEEASLALDARRTQIRAPRAGLVLNVSAKLGALSAPTGGPLFTLAAESAFDLEVPLPPSDLDALSLGAEATLPDGTTATLVALPAEIEASGLGKARFALPQVWRAGQSITLSLPLAQSQGLALPQSAVLYQGGPHVMVVEDGRSHLRPVALGLSAEGLIEIREGVAINDKIVARAGAFLRDGDRVIALEATE